MPTESELAWAAALVIGEGCFSNSSPVRTRKDGSRTAYFIMGMDDERAMNMFMGIIGELLGETPTLHHYLKRGRSVPHHVTKFSNGTVLRMVEGLWPWLQNTDKADQALRVLGLAGLSLAPSA